MSKWEFVRITLKRAHGGKGESLLRHYPGKPGTKDMPGGATEDNMHRWLATLGAEGWQMVTANMAVNSDGKVDHVFWLQRPVD